MPNTMTRDPQADAWITEMERLRDQSIELITSRFALVIQSLDMGEATGEVAAVLFVADEERIGLADALMNLLVITDMTKSGNWAGASYSHHRGHQIDVAFDAADAGEIKDVAEALA